MMTDSYLNMKEILKLLIFNYVISDYSWSYGNHSISIFIYSFIHLFTSLYIYLFIYVFIYLFINLFIWHIASVQFSVFSKSLSPDKTSTSEPLPRGVFLTLHYHIHFINDRNEEIQENILEFSADRMQQPFHVLISGMWQFYCHSYFALISLCYMVIGYWTFSWMEPMCAAELTWHALKVYNWIRMKHTWWNWHAVPGTAYWNMGHTAGTLRKRGIHFILRNIWHIDVPWNISKIFYFNIFFFSVQHMISIWNCMMFCIVYYVNCTYSELVYLIGTYIVQRFDMKL